MKIFDLDLRQLRALIEVNREGSFGRAGERLGFSQSAISQQIAALERNVGRPMFDRPKGPKKISLTPAGQVMLLHAEEIVERLRHADAQLLELDSVQAGTVRIGSFQSVSVALLPLMLIRIRRDRPSVVVVAVELDDDVAMRESLAAGDFDLSFMVGAADDRFETQRVLLDPFVLIAPRGADLPPTVTPQMLAPMAMIGELLTSCQGLVETGLAQHDVCLDYVFRSGDNGAIQAMVRAGVGVAVVPSLAVDLSDPDVALHPIVPPIPPREISIAWRAGETLSPAARAVVDATVIEAERLSHTRAMLQRQAAALV